MSALPDLFTLDRSVFRTRADWARHRLCLLDCVVGPQYGGLPLTPQRTVWDVDTPHASPMPGRVRCTGVVSSQDPDYAFRLTLWLPDGMIRPPVVLTGDGLGGAVADAVTALALSMGVALAHFDRQDLAPDHPVPDRDTHLYASAKGSFGALAAWAWGYHRCVDVLEAAGLVDSKRMAVVGHSRGGKASLLAGATDTRIRLTGANGSGAGGAGCYRALGPGAESLEDLLQRFPYWFGPGMAAYADQVQTLPFDQHFLKAAVAPRWLYTTEALDDHWANPDGTWLTHIAALQVFHRLRYVDRAGVHFRKGGHAHTHIDWLALLTRLVSLPDDVPLQPQQDVLPG